MQALANGSLRVWQSRLYQTNAGVFMRDGEAYAVDPSILADEIDALAKHIVDSGARLRGIILTHSHWDHILGPERIPGVPVIAHASVAANLAADLPEITRIIADRTAEHDVVREAPFQAPHIDVEVGATLTLPFGKGGLRCIHSPGHCSDQLVVYETLERTLWAADMLSDIEIPFIEDCGAYRATLERLMLLDIATLVPGHGNVTKDRDEIRARLTSDHRYLVALEGEVARLTKRGRSFDQISQELSGWSVRHPETNAKEHLRNVEIVYRITSGER
jgi:hydroxyacylglutathione hydrolase